VNDFLTQLRERLPFILAVAFTTLWLVLVSTYVSSSGGMAGLKELMPPELAVLIAAAAGPLAALWLLMAVFEQRRAMSHFARRVTEMMAQNRQSIQQAESQTRTLIQLQAQSARVQAMETRRMALQDMAANVSVLAERLGVMSRDTANDAWIRYGAGDVNVFVQSFLAFAVSHGDIAARMAEAVVRDPVAATALAAFVRRYERLADSIKDDKLATEIFDDGALGRAYRLFKSADEQAQRLLSPASAAAPMPQSAPLPETQASEVAADPPLPEDDLFAIRRLEGLSKRLEAVVPTA
jgi:hypothetical protein